jgi:hypothetical protein
MPYAPQWGQQEREIEKVYACILYYIFVNNTTMSVHVAQNYNILDFFCATVLHCKELQDGAEKEMNIRNVIFSQM